ncbi:hypothetical protein FQN51_006522 [Onygenales sp. PD_10]|nr:hypothetical protein FQN51_006522 [Onygenales sp. PD_10]
MPSSKGASFDYERYNRQLAAVRIPDKVKCKFCSKICSSSNFSKRQLEELRKAMLRNRTTTAINGPGYAGCFSCLAGQTSELTCCVCDKTKSLEHFSKNQRRDPDNARCFNCVQGHLELEPVSEELAEQPGDEGSMYGTSLSQSHGGDDLLYSMRAFSLLDHGSRMESISEYDGNVGGHNSTIGDLQYDSDSDDGAGVSVSGGTGTGTGGVWLEQGRRRQTATVTRNNEGDRSQKLSFTAFDAQGVPHVRTAATPSVAGTMCTAWEDWPREEREKENGNRPFHQMKGNPGFAKITGGRIPKGQRAAARIPEPETPTVDLDDDDDEDDEDDIQNYI